MLVDSFEMAENAPDKDFSKGEVNGSDGETPTFIQEKKHATMLKHLADLNNAHLQQSQSCKFETLSAPVFESVDLFLKGFSETKQKIQKLLDEFHEETSPQVKTLLKLGLETLALDINGLEKLVAVNSYFLPSYEVRNAQPWPRSCTNAKRNTQCSETGIEPTERERGGRGRTRR
jgi:hypothetical protein